MLLAAFGMLYGLHYALLVEHQTLDRMGGSLAESFSAAATHNTPESQGALARYGDIKYDYVRQVDAHSHWIGLAMLMIVLGAIFQKVNFTEGMRQVIAFALLAGSTLFPLSVILQTYHHGAFVLKALAVVASGLIVAALTAIAWGFARPQAAA